MKKMQQAYCRNRRGFDLRILLSFMLFVLLSPAAGICDSLTIPIEWYYGRWPSGHAAEGHFPVGNEKVRFDDGSSSYTYSNGSIRVGVNRFQDLLLISDDADHRVTADFTFGYRPARNWQISLNSLVYSTRSTNRSNLPPNPSLGSHRSRQFSANVSLDWSSKSDISVSSSWQRYIEYIRSTVGQGQLKYRLSLSSNLNSSNGTLNQLNSIFIWSSSSTRSNSGWRIQNSLQGAVSDKWHFSLDVSSFLSKTSWDTMEIFAADGLRRILHEKLEAKSFQPSYRLRNIFNPTNDIFVELSIFQSFRGFSAIANEEIITNDTIIELSQRILQDQALQETQTTLGGRIDILSEGSFVSSIVLDDYAGYYHKMLFEGQYHGQLTFDYNKYGNATERNFKSMRMRHTSRYGLSKKVNIGGSLSYNWRDSRTGWTSLSSVLDLQWRSYDYQPGSSPGWSQDSPLDIQYGPIKRPGHLFVSIATRLPTLSNNNGEGFLSFGGLKSDENWSISTTLVAGLPWQSEVRTTSTLLLIHNESDWHFFRIALAKRMSNKLEFSIDYIKDRPSRLARAAGLVNDYVITFNVRGLL